MEENRTPKNDFSRQNNTIGNAEVNYDIKINKGFDTLLSGQEISSFEFNEKEQTITVVFREHNNIILTTNPPQMAPDKIWKEVYGIKDSKITLLKKIEGKHTPAKSIEEKVEFDELS